MFLKEENNWLYKFWLTGTLLPLSLFDLLYKSSAKYQ